MVRPASLVLFVALTACHKPAPVGETTDAAAVAPPASVTTPAPAPFAEGSASPSGAAPARYTFAKQVDPLGRWTVEVPTAFARTESRACSDSGCLLRTSFAGDGLLVELVPGEGNGSPALAAGVRGGKITGEKALPRGFWVTMTAKDNHVFVQRVAGFAEPIELVVTGPLTRKKELESLVGRLSSSLVVAATPPASYCRPLPWGDAGVSPMADFDGTLALGAGFDAKMTDERPYVLQLDGPVCDVAGRACWEAQVYSLDKSAALKSLVGRRVHVAGTFHGMETAHHHRPVMIAVTSIGVQ